MLEIMIIIPAAFVMGAMFVSLDPEPNICIRNFKRCCICAFFCILLLSIIFPFLIESFMHIVKTNDYLYEARNYSLAYSRISYRIAINIIYAVIFYFLFELIVGIINPKFAFIPGEKTRYKVIYIYAFLMLLILLFSVPTIGILTLLLEKKQYTPHLVESTQVWIPSRRIPLLV